MSHKAAKMHRDRFWVVTAELMPPVVCCCAWIPNLLWCFQVGTIIEMLTGRKAELLEVDQVDQGFGAAPSNPDAASSADNSSSSSPAAAGAGGGGGGNGSGVLSSSSRQRLLFEVPARGMIGFKSLFASITRGEGLMQRAFAR